MTEDGNLSRSFGKPCAGYGIGMIANIHAATDNCVNKTINFPQNVQKY